MSNPSDHSFYFDQKTGHYVPPRTEQVGTVADISDSKLVERAVRNARRKKMQPKWAAVADAFGLGSTYAHQLCHRFGIDPDQVRKK